MGICSFLAANPSSINPKDQDWDVDVRNATALKVPDKLLKIRNAGTHLFCKRLYGNGLDSGANG